MKTNGSMRKIRLLAVLLIVCGLVTAHYTIPRNLGFGETTVAEVDKTGFFKMFFYAPDINWDKESCYPYWGTLTAIPAADLQDILDCLPNLKGRRMAPFEWKPEWVNTSYPCPVSLRVAYGGSIDASWYFTCYFAQKDNQYTVVLRQRGKWYELTDADDFIQAVLRHYPEKDIWIPELNPHYVYRQ